MSPALAQIAEEFQALPEPERLQLLLEFSNNLPELPERYVGHPELLERVAECQSPVWIIVEVNEGSVEVFAQAPAEAPTTRGFASILIEGLHGLSVQEVLDVPADYPSELGLSRAISPLRLRGMTGMLGRIQRQTALKAGVLPE
ncbi:SufE family protein [Humidisolicoccus flavus]|uniref:SufE family protein n=1 Tax=Humidisolicoccus flavus TaxID=3111414 RepID=UPI00324F0EBF